MDVNKLCEVIRQGKARNRLRLKSEARLAELRQAHATIQTLIDRWSVCQEDPQVIREAQNTQDLIAGIIEGYEMNQKRRHTA